MLDCLPSGKYELRNNILKSKRKYNYLSCITYKTYIKRFKYSLVVLFVETALTRFKHVLSISLYVKKKFLIHLIKKGYNLISML